MSVARAKQLLLTVLRLWMPASMKRRCPVCGAPLRTHLDAALYESALAYDRAVEDADEITRPDWERPR